MYLEYLNELKWVGVVSLVLLLNVIFMILNTSSSDVG